MSPSEQSWVPQDVLWELGASFIDANPQTAAGVIDAAILRVATLLNGTAIGVWAVDPLTMSGRAVHRWSASALVDLGDDFIATPDPSVQEAVVAGGGLAILDLDKVVGAETCRERGWTGGYALVALIEEQPSEIVALVLVSLTNEWSAPELELIRGTVMLLRQLHSRLRSEDRLEQRLRLDELTVTLASRLQSVSPETIDETIDDALARLRSTLDLEAVVLVDVVDDGLVAIPAIVANRELPDDWRLIPIPDISALPGAHGSSLRDYIAEPRVTDLGDLVDALLGADVTTALGLRNPTRAVALLPASVQFGDSLLAVSRMGAGDWTARELDVLSTLASMIAQTRARVAAERASRDLLDAQRALVATGKIFLEAGGADAGAAIHEAIERMAAHLGADLAVVASLGTDRETVTITDSWARADELAVEVGSTLDRKAVPILDRFIAGGHDVHVNLSSDALVPELRGSTDGKWTSIVSPIRGGEPVASALVFVWAGGDIADLPAARELADAMADLISQFEVRLRAESEVTRRLRIDEALSDIAEDFLGTSLESADAAFERAFARFGEELGLRGLSLRVVEQDRVVVERGWASEGCHRPVVGSALVLEGPIVGADIVSFEQHQSEPHWSGVVAEQWGPGVRLSVLRIMVGGAVESLLSVAGLEEFTASELDALRSFSVMLGQFRARLAEERLGERRLAAQRTLSRCAADLAEATPDDYPETLGRVLDLAAEFCELDVLVDLVVDVRHERYAVSHVWTERDGEVEIPTSPCWGDLPLIDEARQSGVTVQRSSGPDIPAPVRLAVPRGDGEVVEHVLFAASRSPAPWPQETIDLLDSLSRMIHEVDTRTAAQRYAEAAFQGAPIGVVLRDDLLNLITCNQAFMDFVGAESIDELIGTAPQHVYADNFETVDWVEEANGQLTAEAAFRGPEGSQVWGQMRGSVIGGEAGEHLWLVHIEDVTERRRAEQLLRFQASHDELTGLANRRRLLDEIHRVAAGSGSVAVLLLDLDRFKNVNDSLGHDRGDELLVVIADRLRLAVRPGDLVARLGGDEFAVVLPGPVDVADAEFVAERLMRLIGEPVVLGRQKIYPTASIGIAVADDHTEVDDLIRRADTAMYRAKAEGRARAESFDEELREAVQARMETESGLRGALRSDELVVHYQPEVSLHDGRVIGAEALIRWRHPTKGLLPAGAFIEVAEETGLVVELGELVLAAACAEAAGWPETDDGPLLRVNLAAAQLQREDTVALVRSVLNETGLDPGRLCLEITESAVMSDVGRSEKILHRLKGLGVHLAVDDFGTGFSSLAYLKRFPVDALKIDRAFVRDLDHDTSDVAFVRSIVSLADALGLDVVAEGVETAEQAEILLQLGCHRAQGFYFAKPGPPSAVRDRLLERTN